MRGNLPFIRHQLQVLDSFENMGSDEREEALNVHVQDTSYVIAGMESCLNQQPLAVRARFSNWRAFRDCCPSSLCMKSEHSLCNLKLIPRNQFLQLAKEANSKNSFREAEDFIEIYNKADVGKIYNNFIRFYIYDTYLAELYLVRYHMKFMLHYTMKYYII